MITKEFRGEALSALGLGNMRLPLIDGNDAMIDEAAAAEMVDYALKQGINYFDTAWGYHSGNSELVIGKILEKYPRDSFYLATKFPGYDKSNMEKVEEIFERQLEKCRVDYFDFYLFHNVSDGNIDLYLDRKYGLMEYLLKQKENGRIRHLGFSTHGNLDTMRRFLEAYGEHMEFCQIQLNYLDWTYQNAKEKMELLKEYHLPVWVMEPVRGGKLAKLAQADEEKLMALRPEEKTPAWAFRFLQNLPEVTMVLSGMSDMEQLQDNIATFSEEKPLKEEELEVLLKIADGMMNGMVPCTECRYCVSKCPQELDIPDLIEIYNNNSLTGKGKIGAGALKFVPEDKYPEHCVGCRSCEAVCPQNIKISEIMADFVERLK